MRVRSSIALIGALAAGASSCRCGGGGGSYEPCLDRTVEAFEPRTIGSTEVSFGDGTLLVRGGSGVVWVASAPVEGSRAIEPWTLAPSDPPASLVIVMGDLGRTEDERAAFADSLAALAVPVIVMPGPRDAVASVEELVERVPSLFDGSAIHRVRVGAEGGFVLRLVPGLSDVHALTTTEACGLGPGALDALVADPSGEPVAIIALEAPRGTVLTRGIEGVEIGSEPMAAAFDRIGASVGVFASPLGAVGRSVPSGVPWPTGGALFLAPPLAGVDLEGTDGSRLTPGVVVLRREGDRLVGVSAASSTP